MTRKIHDTDYLFLTTRVRALEGCLLNRGQMEQMLEAGSLEGGSPHPDRLRLSRTGNGQRNNGGEMLNRERERLFQDLAELVPDPAILAVFQLPHDYHNVKVLLKSEAMGIQEDRLLVDAGRIPSKQLVAALRSGEVQESAAAAGRGHRRGPPSALSHTRPAVGGYGSGSALFPGAACPGGGDGISVFAGICSAHDRCGQSPDGSPCSPYGAGDGIPLEGILFPGGNMEVERLLTGINGGSMLEELYASSPGTGCGIRELWRPVAVP